MGRAGMPVRSTACAGVTKLRRVNSSWALAVALTQKESTAASKTVIDDFTGKTLVPALDRSQAARGEAKRHARAAFSPE